MTVTAVTRPAKPEAPPGMDYVPAAAPGWRVAGESATCRKARPGAVACGRPAVAEKSHPNDPISPWWAYCAEHARTYGRPDVLPRGVWAEDGEVWRWELRRSDGTPATPAQAGAARRKAAAGTGDWCATHKQPVADCDPASRFGVSFRASHRLIADVDAKVHNLGLRDRTAAIEQALEEWVKP